AIMNQSSFNIQGSTQAYIVYKYTWGISGYQRETTPFGSKNTRLSPTSGYAAYNDEIANVYMKNVDFNPSPPQGMFTSDVTIEAPFWRKSSDDSKIGLGWFIENVNPP